MEPEPFSLVLYYMDPRELINTFWDLMACLDYNVKENLQGMCMTPEELDKLNYVGPIETLEEQKP